MTEVMYDKILGRVREGSGFDPNNYIHKVVGAGNGNFPKFDASGGLIDSYFNPTSFPNRYDVPSILNVSANICGAIEVSDVLITPQKQPGEKYLGTAWIVTKKNATWLVFSNIDQGSVTVVVYRYSGGTWSYYDSYSYDFNSYAKKTGMRDVSTESTYAWDHDADTYYTFTDQDTQDPDVYYFNAGVFQQWQATGNESFAIENGVLVYDDGNGNTTNYTYSSQKNMSLFRFYANEFDVVEEVISGGVVTFTMESTGYENGYLNIYSWKFTTGQYAPTINWPAVSWNGGTPPTIEAETTYEINIADGIACWASTPVNN